MSKQESVPFMLQLPADCLCDGMFAIMFYWVSARLALYCLDWSSHEEQKRDLHSAQWSQHGDTRYKHWARRWQTGWWCSHSEGDGSLPQLLKWSWPGRLVKVNSRQPASPVQFVAGDRRPPLLATLLATISCRKLNSWEVITDHSNNNEDLRPLTNLSHITGHLNVE